MYRFFILISLFLATIANAMPRYLIVPIENVRFIGEPEEHMPVYQHRMRRSAWPQDDAAPTFAIPANIRPGDALAAASGLPAHAGHAGPDYVDYGAYTGGYGAYGWHAKRAETTVQVYRG